MNPEAEKLRTDMQGCVWLRDRADAVAELVDAAMEAYDRKGSEAPALRRLAQAVVDLKGPQEPPPAVRTQREGLLCPKQGCMWWVELKAEIGTDAAYRRHYREAHLESGRTTS